MRGFRRAGQRLRDLAMVRKGLVGSFGREIERADADAFVQQFPESHLARTEIAADRKRLMCYVVTPSALPSTTAI